MRILFVCMQYIHSARWINQLKDTHHEIYVFDCLDREIHPDLQWTNYLTNWSKRKLPYIKGEDRVRKKLPNTYKKIEGFLKVTASEKLVEVIHEIQPDLVHSLEMQSESYPLINVRKKLKFKWLYSCWGNDIFYYKDLPSHQKKVKECVEKIDYFFVECERDKNLIQEMKINATFLGTDFPGGGGYDFSNYLDFRKPNAKRNLIIIKGYEHTFGRALSVLKAIEEVVDEVQGYDIYVYSAHQSVIDKIEKLNAQFNLNIEYSSRFNQISHEELLEKFGSAKVAIGNNISDGIPNTLLETLILGAFPIQSNPGGVTEEYITHGENGFLITQPEDSFEISELIKAALSDNNLVENASRINRIKIENLDGEKVRRRVLAAYQKIEEAL